MTGAKRRRIYRAMLAAPRSFYVDELVRVGGRWPSWVAVRRMLDHMEIDGWVVWCFSSVDHTWWVGTLGRNRRCYMLTDAGRRILAERVHPSHGASN